MQQFLCSKWVWNEERLKTQMSWNIQKVKVKICQTSRNDEKKSNVKDCHTTAKIIRLKLVKTLEVNFFSLLNGVESDLEDVTDELINNSDTDFELEKDILKKMTFSMFNLKTFWSLKQTFTWLKIEGKKKKKRVKKRVKKKEKGEKKGNRKK